MKKRQYGQTIFLALVLCFIYLSILILAVYSFTDSAQIGRIHAFSLQNYITLFTSEELLVMIRGTVVLAVVTSLISTVLGTLGAIGAYYSKKGPAAVIRTINQIPVVNAEAVTGFAICILLVVVFGISRDTYIPIVVGYVVLCSPFVYLSVIPKLKQMDDNLYEAALDLGARPFYALRKVLIPQIMPGIVSGFMLSITLALDDYFIATYTKPSTFDTISTYVVNATRGAQTSIKTALWALSTIIFVIVILVVIGMNRSAAKKEEGTVTQG